MHFEVAFLELGLGEWKKDLMWEKDSTKQRTCSTFMTSPEDVRRFCTTPDFCLKEIIAHLF